MRPYSALLCNTFVTKLFWVKCIPTSELHLADAGLITVLGIPWTDHVTNAEVGLSSLTALLASRWSSCENGLLSLATYDD